MTLQPDVKKPRDDPYGLVQQNWPSESEAAYHSAETEADNAATTAKIQAESADDAANQTDSGMQGKTADSVSGVYSHIANQLHQQSADYNTISGWMLDASGKVEKAKSRIANLVRVGTSEIRDAINSETSGTVVTPSSSELTDKYRDEISSVVTTLTSDLDGIGRSLQGDPGSSRTPSYVSVPTMPSAEQPDPRAIVAAYNHGQAPEVVPQQLPEMPRATTAPTVDSPSGVSTPSAPAAPHSVNPTLANLLGAGQSAPSGTPTPPTTSSSSGSPNTPAGQGAQTHQPTEHRQDAKSAGLPHIPSIPLPDLLPAVAESIATGVSAATASQLPASTAPTSPGSSIPASTGTTPGVSGTPPMPSGLAPIGGVPTSTPTMQATPSVQGTPAFPPPGVQTPTPQQAPAPAAPRGPVADIGWIQKTYGIAPSLDLPKPEFPVLPACFIVDLPEAEAHLHRALASLRQEFEQAGWSQPLAIATLRRGFEVRTVYVTSDGLSIHPSGVLLPSGVIPLDEMPNTPVAPELSGSIMVTDKLASLIPRGWEVESLLSTVPSNEQHQTPEQFQELVEGGELLPCTVSRGRVGVTADEAMGTFARAALGSGGGGELDSESARLRAARWVGAQPAGYLDTLSRYYLADAAEAMSQGDWTEAVWACEKYMNVNQTRSQAA
ncbi:Uncharacterised protein [Mycobacteroides abscessus subsp. massiliense]|uniref:hypothetical protein n=1 Tax=Mycobacteroides abscessus TaxID=36809 RepID=UPI0009A80F00|nr:hypothetical protein [Mycobacteroides abscessus]SKU64718.1 Uncharacterised protein [Mycobacteroides abscessus subsp. massiliense]